MVWSSLSILRQPVSIVCVEQLSPLRLSSLGHHIAQSQSIPPPAGLIQSPSPNICICHNPGRSMSVRLSPFPEPLNLSLYSQVYADEGGDSQLPLNW